MQFWVLEGELIAQLQQIKRRPIEKRQVHDVHISINPIHITHSKPAFAFVSLQWLVLLPIS